MPSDRATVPNSTPSQVAEAIGVSTNTIRRYAHEFQGHLSPDANPGHGAQRGFTAEDVAILRAARAHLVAGQTYERVNLLLETVVVGVEDTPARSAGEDVATVTGGDALALLVAAIRPLVATGEQVDRIAGEVQQLATDRATDAHTVQQLAQLVAQMGEDRTRPLVYLVWFGAGFALALLLLWVATLVL